MGMDKWSSSSEKEHAMTDAQIVALVRLCDRYHVPFQSRDYLPRFDLPDGWVAGWVGSLYVGCSPEGEISS